MVQRLITRMRVRPPNDRAASVFTSGIPAASAATMPKACRVEHRNGSGHLDPTYEAALRTRVHDRARNTGERAFVSGTARADSSAADCGENFVMTVTSGEDGGGDSALDEETSEERGGPFVESNASVEFAYDTDASNPTGATREPFPTS
jgi:hypothetical protein